MFWANTVNHQMSYNFKVNIGNKDVGIMWDAKRVTLPKYDVEVKEDLVGNVSLYSTGKGTWNPIEIEIYDIKPITGIGINKEAYMSNANRVFGTLVDTKGARKVTGQGTFNIDEGSTFTELDGNTRRVTQITIEKYYGQRYNSAPEFVDDPLLGAAVVGTNGQFSEIWTLVNPVLKGVDFGTLDYSSEEINTVTMIFHYEYAYLTKDENQGLLQGIR